MKSWYISGDAILQWFVPLQKNEIKKIMKMHFWVHLDVEIKKPMMTACIFPIFINTTVQVKNTDTK